jgi:hypothetical protein
LPISPSCVLLLETLKLFETLFTETIGKDIANLLFYFLIFCFDKSTLININQDSSTGIPQL